MHIAVVTETHLRMPLDPVYTSITLGLEGSIVIMRSALSATSAGLSTICVGQRQKQQQQQRQGETDGKYFTKIKRNSLLVCYSHACAPSSCTSLQDSGNTSVAMMGYPCFSKFFAIGFPMLPKPMNPTGVFEARDLEDTTTKGTHKFKFRYDVSPRTQKRTNTWLLQIIKRVSFCRTI